VGLASGDDAVGRKPGRSGSESTMHAVVLIGFMGAGKTSVGRALAKHLNWGFEDLDYRIERRDQRKIHEIFRERGEAEFRLTEHAALKELVGEMNSGSEKVVAVGGGAFVQKQNAKLIEDAGIPTVFLDATVGELWERCQAQADRVERPLLKSLADFRELYKTREPHYAKALFRQQTSGKTVNEIALEIADMLGLSSGSAKRGKRGETN
jgi:shikimate kinase